MRLWVTVLLLAACKYVAPTGQTPGDGAPGDSDRDTAIDPDARIGPGDGGFDAPTLPAAACFGTFVSVCLPAPLPNADRTINNLSIDTDNPADCHAVAIGTNVDACVIAAENIFINGTLIATGSRPLILIGTRFDGQVIVNGNGVIDVASRRVGGALTRGAGGNPAGCANVDPPGAAGAAGGAFGGNAGNGGNGDGGAGVNGANAVDATTLRGGCPGGRGGNQGGLGGNGGGAVALIAPNILINNDINASGSSGLGGEGVAAGARGGGGGGSGGFIVFDATNLTLNSATLMAQGGGGGQGSLAVANGQPGSDPTFATIGTAAAGGNAALGGGVGGVGGSNGNAGNAGNSAGGGGGGGGSTGRIHRHTMTIQGSAQSSPGIVAL